MIFLYIKNLYLVSNIPSIPSYHDQRQFYPQTNLSGSSNVPSVRFQQNRSQQFQQGISGPSTANRGGIFLIFLNNILSAGTGQFGYYDQSNIVGSGFSGGAQAMGSHGSNLSRSAQPSFNNPGYFFYFVFGCVFEFLNIFDICLKKNLN